MRRLTERARRVGRGATLAVGMLATTPAWALAESSAQTQEVDPKVQMAKYIAAAIAMGASALGAAYAQAKIGSAAAGTLAEKPEAGTMLIVLQALPEIIVLLGFVSALIISG